MEVNNHTKAGERASDETGTTFMNVTIVTLLALVIAFGFGLFDRDPSPAGATIADYPSDFLSSVIGDDSPESPPGASYPHIVYRDGVLYVRGIAPNQARVDETMAELEPLFGAENVIAEVLVDPNFVEDPNSETSVYFSENVLFESGSSIVGPEFLDVLGASAAFLQISHDTTLEITGHTDSNGDENSNLDLSQQRVDAAREAMIEQGGDADRITAIGFGETHPIADNSTVEGRKLNRRVELSIGTEES